ncbi:MAG: dihydrofolate reductase family protein [Solirubrobacterales bacterium]
MSSKVILYIASTLDGYIATSDGGIDWLTSYDGGNHGYEDLMERTGALAMGSGTFDFFEGVDTWPYPDQTSWVFTSKDLDKGKFEDFDIRAVSGPPADAIDRIVESAGGKDVWLLGGGVLFAEFLKAGLVDQIIHFLAPKALSSGIPMFTEPVLDAFQMDDVKLHPEGMIELHYRPA